MIDCIHIISFVETASIGKNKFLHSERQAFTNTGENRPDGQQKQMLEELLELGVAAAEYDAYTINIGEGKQFGSGFVAINPSDGEDRNLTEQLQSLFRCAVRLRLSRMRWVFAAITIAFPTLLPRGL